MALAVEFQHLKQGEKYQVVEAFQDYDGIHYTEGLDMVFIGAHLQAIEKALSLFFFLDEKRTQIRLKWEDDYQGEICDDLCFFID